MKNYSFISVVYFLIFLYYYNYILLAVDIDFIINLFVLDMCVYPGCWVDVICLF